MKENKQSNYYITGDTHRDFFRLQMFSLNHQTTQDDVMIILGDAGINYYLGNDDLNIKRFLTKFPLTFFCIHGNHEARPEKIKSYKEVEWNCGIVYVEKEFPNILFAKDGEIYNINGYKTLVCGGAYSVDKFIRLSRGLKWFDDEQPSDDTKRIVEQCLDNENWDVDIVLTHTCPLKYEPIEWFISGLDQSKIDKSTEKWLDTIENKLSYRKWYVGHFHGDKHTDKLTFMFNNIEKFSPYNESKLE